MLRRREIDCKLPRNVSDESVGEVDASEEKDTMMTSILHLIKIHQLTEQVVSLFSDTSAPLLVVQLD